MNATATMPEPVTRDTHQRGLAWEELSDLVLAARRTERAVVRDASDENIAADDAALQRLFDALHSIERERNRFREALEKIAETPVARTARSIAREALATEDR